MSYIGSPPKQSFTSGLLDRFTSTTGTTVTLTNDIASENDIVVFVNFVKQDSTTYSVGGTGNKTLTLGGTLVSSDIVEVHYLNIVGQTVAPSSGSVGSSQLTSGAVTGAKLNTDVISAQTELASGVASTDELLISDAGTLKRVDVSLVGGTNVPFTTAKSSSDQTINHGTETKITFDAVVNESSSSLFDLSNNKFTVATAGTYLILPTLRIYDSSNRIERAECRIFKNGSAKKVFMYYDGGYSSSQSRETTLGSGFLETLAQNDYIEMYTYVVTNDSGSVVAESDNLGTTLGVMKLIT